MRSWYSWKQEFFLSVNANCNFLFVVVVFVGFSFEFFFGGVGCLVLGWFFVSLGVFLFN